MRFSRSTRAVLFLRFHTLCVLLISATAAATKAPAASFEQDACWKSANGMNCLRLAQRTADAKMANGRLQRFCTNELPSAFAAFEAQIQEAPPQSRRRRLKGSGGSIAVRATGSMRLAAGGACLSRTACPQRANRC